MDTNGYSLSDIASAAGSNAGLDGSNSWVLIILFALIFGNGGFFGNNTNTARTATAEDVQRATDFQALERQNNESVAATRQAAYDVTGSVKDTAYNILGELRDVQAQTLTGFGNTQSAISEGFANMQKCCCETLRAIDSVNYNGAINTASINANTAEQTQKILDAISANRMADMQNQINQLQLQNAVSGVVRYPSASTYYAGSNPFCGNSCGCSSL